jgi:hypothetical protein
MTGIRAMSGSAERRRGKRRIVAREPGIPSSMKAARTFPSFAR